MNKIIKKIKYLNNEKGSIGIMSSYAMGMVMLVLSGSAYQGALFQEKAFQRDVDKVVARAVAEAGIQQAMYQVGQDAYTGYINETDISATTMQSVFGDDVGDFEVDIDYSNQDDWVVITSTATIGDYVFVSEGRIFLESTLSKYAVYITRSTTGGSNLQLGEDDGMVDNDGDTIDDTPEGVPENAINRAKFYYDGSYTFGGSGIDIWGDFYIEGGVTGHSSYTTEIHGDLYVENYEEDSNGAVTNDGISNAHRVDVDDGFEDDIDRDGDDDVDASDYPDIHDLTDTGFEDAEARVALPTVNISFYETNNDIPDFNAQSTRYLVFEDDGTGDHTVVKQLTASQFSSWRSSGTYSGSPTATYDLPTNAIVFNDGDLYMGGEITGRVTVVSDDDIFLDKNFTYEGGQLYADTDHSAAIIAYDNIYLRADSLVVSGILYARNATSGSPSMVANQNVNGNTDNSKSYLRFYGNTLMGNNSSTNTGVYSDRAWIWDPNLMKYRPPGIPVEPEIRVVRQVIEIVEDDS